VTLVVSLATRGECRRSWGDGGRADEIPSRREERGTAAGVLAVVVLAVAAVLNVVFWWGLNDLRTPIDFFPFFVPLAACLRPSQAHARIDAGPVNLYAACDAGVRSGDAVARQASGRR